MTAKTKSDTKEISMKKKYTLEEDGFVGYWHPSDKHEGHAYRVPRVGG